MMNKDAKKIERQASEAAKRIRELRRMSKAKRRAASNAARKKAGKRVMHSRPVRARAKSI